MNIILYENNKFSKFKESLDENYGYMTLAKNNYTLYYFEKIKLWKWIL